jgi:hypothetical protein
MVGKNTKDLNLTDYPVGIENYAGLLKLLLKIENINNTL